MESYDAAVRRQNSRYIECGPGGEGGYVRVAFSTCVRQSGKLAVCVSASMSSVCVSLSQIASHRKRASVLLLSSPRSRERARRALGKEGMQRQG